MKHQPSTVFPGRSHANAYLPKPDEIVDKRFAEDLAKSGFLNELWGKEIAK